MTTLQMKIGNSELTLESASALSPDELDNAFKAFERFRGMVGASPMTIATSGDGGSPPASNGGIDASIDMFVSRLGGDSCRALLKAAAAHLTLVDGQAVFGRQLWFERAQEAHEWRADYSSNRARDVRRMISSKEMIEKQGGMYALTPRVAAEIRAKFLDE